MIRNLAYIGAFTLFVVFVWIVVVLYDSLTSNTISGNIKKQINPLGKNFNEEALNNLEKRKQVPADLSEPQEISSVTPVINQPAQIDLILPGASPSGQNEQAQNL